MKRWAVAMLAAAHAAPRRPPDPNPNRNMYGGPDDSQGPSRRRAAAASPPPCRALAVNRPPKARLHQHPEQEAFSRSHPRPQSQPDEGKNKKRRKKQQTTTVAAAHASSGPSNRGTPKPYGSDPPPQREPVSPSHLQIQFQHQPRPSHEKMGQRNTTGEDGNEEEEELYGGLTRREVFEVDRDRPDGSSPPNIQLTLCRVTTTTGVKKTKTRPAGSGFERSSCGVLTAVRQLEDPRDSPATAAAVQFREPLPIPRQQQQQAAANRRRAPRPATNIQRQKPPSQEKPKKERKIAATLSNAEKRSEKYRRVPLDALVCPKRSPYKLLQENYASDPWKVIVICMLLNCTQGSQVRQVLDEFFKRFPDAQTAWNANLQDMVDCLRPLGFQKRKSERIKKFSLDYVNKDWTYVTELHGVGKYAADAYAIFCAGRHWDVEPEDHKLVDYWKYVCDYSEPDDSDGF